MQNEELRTMVREIVREELARYLQTGLAALADHRSAIASQADDEDAMNEEIADDAFNLLEQHSDVMASWMSWAADEADEAEWRDFDG